MESNEDEITKIDKLNNYMWENRSAPKGDKTTEELLHEIISTSNNINYPYGHARASLNLSMHVFISKNDLDLSLKLINGALEFFKKQKNPKWVSNTLMTLSIITNSTGSPESALYHALKGIEFYENNKTDVLDANMAYYVVGTVYKDLKKHNEAEKYYLKGLSFKEDANIWTARIQTGLSNIYNERGEYHKALDLILKSIEVNKKENNKGGESRALNDIGLIYRKLKEYDLSLDYLQKGLNIRKEIKRIHLVLSSYIEIAETYLEMGNLSAALNYLLISEPIAVEINHTGKLSILYRQIASIYKKNNEFKEAVAYFEKLNELFLVINKKEKEQKINESQHIILQEKIQEIERLKNVELKNAYDLISTKNKEILDSIHYAKRIQDTLLASKDLFASHLKEYFILFEPKDIVSGDFYWATKKDDRFYIAVCDSTGHGVPGAFMSLLNITFLNEAINEKSIIEPHLIFNYVRDRIIQTISQDGAQDGMDGILICIKENQRYIKYAAANNALILANGNNVKDLPYDKMPVGKGERNNSFQLFEIELRANEILYLSTDGYADQFGGLKGKKFKYKNLLEKIIQLNQLPLTIQMKKLKNSFIDWKGDLEQVDDVCIVGIRL